MDFETITKKRYAVKEFDGSQIDEASMDKILEFVRLAPSSFGLQPFKVKVVSDKETKEKLLGASYNQPQITTCSHLLVFCALRDVMGRVDKYEKMMVEGGAPEEKAKGYTDMMRGFLKGMSGEELITWAQKQIYIAISQAMNGAQSLGVDSCPMEGFLPEKYSEILELDEGLVPTVLVTLGKAADTPRDKIRYGKDELFF